MESAWISVAILSAACLGLVNIIDSHLISKRMPGFRAYLLMVSPFILFFGLLFAYLFPLPEGLSAWQLIVAIASGILRATAVTILLYSLRREEVSRAVPVVSTYPIFVIIMAVPLLGETLNYLQGMAIAIVVVGVVLVSVRKRPGSPANRLGITFFLLLGSSLLLAIADVAGKYALAYISSWNIFWISVLTMAVIFLFVSWRRHIIQEWVKIIKLPSVLMLVAVNEVLVVAGAILLFWAMKRGPVSLVSTITSTRPVFVVLYALILTRFRPEFLLERKLSWRALMVRLVAISLIVGGVALIYTA